MNISNYINDFLQITEMVKNPKDSIFKQSQQLQEEMYNPNELMDSLNKKDLVGVLDGTGDVGFVLCSVHILINPEDAYDYAYEEIYQYLSTLTKLPKQIVIDCIKEVALSNLSKFDNTEKQSLETKTFYNSIGVTTETSFLENLKVYVTKSSCEQTDKSGKTYHKGKILKSATNYVEPDFTQQLQILDNLGFTFND